MYHQYNGKNSTKNGKTTIDFFVQCPNSCGKQKYDKINGTRNGRLKCSCHQKCSHCTENRWKQTEFLCKMCEKETCSGQKLKFTRSLQQNIIFKRIRWSFIIFRIWCSTRTGRCIFFNIFGGRRCS